MAEEKLICVNDFLIHVDKVGFDFSAFIHA
jgi:hypothetical protein